MSRTMRAGNQAGPAAIAVAACLCWAILGSGCAQHARVLCEPLERVADDDAAGAVRALDRTSIADSSNDAFLYHAVRGQLLQLSGDLEASNSELEAAVATADALEPWSATATLTDYLVNETVKDYAGEDYERAYLHYYLAKNYIAEGDTEGALVELRRLDEVFRKLDARYEDDRRYQDDGFIRYLSGLVYESVGRLDDARVDYRLALAAYDSGGGLDLGVPVPGGLRQSLARLESGLRPETEIVVVIENGWAPYKREASLEVPIYAPFVPEEMRGASWLAAYVKIAYPEFVSVPVPGWFEAAAGDPGCGAQGARRAQAELVQDLDALAREVLERRLGAIQLRSTMRATAKQVALMKAKHEGEEAREEKEEDEDGDKHEDDGGWSWLWRALLENFVTVAVAETEQADTRSWVLLPREIWILRIPVEPGDYEVCVFPETVREGRGAPIELGRVSVRPGGKAFRFCRVFGGPHPVRCRD